MLHRFSIVPCALTVLVSAHLFAQQPPTIKTNVPLVLVPVTVTDKKGVSIDGLSVEDFILTDDGVRQTVRMDTSDTVLAPISLVVAVQCSGISAAVLAKNQSRRRNDSAASGGGAWTRRGDRVRR